MDLITYVQVFDHANLEQLLTAQITRQRSRIRPIQNPPTDSGECGRYRHEHRNTRDQGSTHATIIEYLLPDPR